MKRLHVGVDVDAVCTGSGDVGVKSACPWICEGTDGMDGIHIGVDMGGVDGGAAGGGGGGLEGVAWVCT